MSLSEGAEVGSDVFMMEASDTSGPVTYSLEEDNHSHFSIDHNGNYAPDLRNL